MADWKAIRTEYITTNISQRELAKKYKVSSTSIAKHSAKEHWTELRKQNFDKTCAKIVEKESDIMVKRYARLMSATDRLLDKVEQAIDEIDMHIAKTTHKTKVIEYKNHDCPNKATKEVIEEQEEILAYQSIVDKVGLRQVASALKDIKEVQMLKSELDKAEQEARIAKLKNDIKADNEDNDSECGVVILPAIVPVTPPAEDEDNA